MGILLVTYDLNKEAVRPKIVTEVKKTAWARLSESSYAIDTSETPQAVYNRFRYLLNQNDNFLVLRLRRPHFGQNKQAVIDWLEERLQW